MSLLCFKRKKAALLQKMNYSPCCIVKLLRNTVKRNLTGRHHLLICMHDIQDKNYLQGK